MIVVRRLLGLFQDSPVYSRDRANLITGFTVGTTGLLLNGAVLTLVLPVLINPDGHSIRAFAENVEFGQLLAVILLGGAAMFATVLIPLRLVTVFWESRIGRYFDQIILSGISPLRFLIGKVTSQNLFLALISFLLLPYLVLSLTLGGVDLSFFIAGLFLVWLYCMALASVTLWVSLYFNELLSAIAVILAAGIVAMLGCMPMRIQPFVLTPFPMLISPVFGAGNRFDGIVHHDYFPVFISSVAAMTAMIVAALFAIYLGPLYGIIRENSTFGEVVRAGDSKRKRWLRFRLHIQRSSEIAFFYKNRSRTFLGFEGLLRWGTGLCGALMIVFVADALFVGAYRENLPDFSVSAPQSPAPWRVFQFYALGLTIHGWSLAIAICLFSHTKNTTFMRLRVVPGWTAEVSTLDTSAFLLFAVLSTMATAAIPFLFERFIAAPGGSTLFPSNFTHPFYPGQKINFVRIVREGTAVVSLAGLVVYGFQRYVCLGTWTRTAAIAIVGFLYYILICILPLAAALCLQIDELRAIPLLVKIAPIVMMFSPITVMIYIFDGQFGPQFPGPFSTVPFYCFHTILFCFAMIGIRARGRQVRQTYLVDPARESVHD